MRIKRRISKAQERIMRYAKLLTVFLKASVNRLGPQRNALTSSITEASGLDSGSIKEQVSLGHAYHPFFEV